ncbi:DUF1854 domain-containing protein [Candidatus Poribacteria bacterium]|nr:DUF1854 domain-containing protein [Candidatus Poribacteria bacterium]
MKGVDVVEQPIRIEDEVQFLDPKLLKVSRNQFAELEAELPDGSVHAPVEPVRTFPLTQPNQYISLLDAHKNELGLIEDISQLREADQAVLMEELEKCYFMPKITRIHFIEGRFGVTQWEAETDSGTVFFDLRSRHDITSLNGGRVLIKDIDGNRYEIVNYHRLDPKSIALLETQI